MEFAEIDRKTKTTFDNIRNLYLNLSQQCQWQLEHPFPFFVQSNHFNDIKKAYRKMAIISHPDKLSASPKKRKNQRNQNF